MNTVDQELEGHRKRLFGALDRKDWLRKEIDDRRAEIKRLDADIMESRTAISAIEFAMQHDTKRGANEAGDDAL